MINENEFLVLTEQVLEAIECQVDKWMTTYDVDVEIKRAGNVLNLVFENDEHVVINSQLAVQEIWVAARSGGFHFKYSGKKWLNTRTGLNLSQTLSPIFTNAIKQPITLQI